MSITDLVKKRGFTVVNVSHNADYRRTFLHFLFVFFVFFQKFFDHIDYFFFFTEHIEFQSDFFSCLVINFLVDCYNLALHEEFLNDYGWLDLHCICKFLDCK